MTATDLLQDLLTRATRDQWRVYGYDAGDWMPLGTAVDSLVEAQLKQQALARRHHGIETRIVREGFTYQIEEQQP